MNVGELKKYIAKLPDDTLLLFDDRNVIGLDEVLGCTTRKVRKGTSVNGYFVSMIESSPTALILYTE